MRISKIKIAGFKSFVDPTTLNLPGNLTGVVGPNGCGKSNIIDAVNWAMGEASAKHLRGESMADVIFNGSNTRQPVGQAFVEIILDNTDGAIGGQYAGFGEISVKRQVSRDGLSTYQLNATRCRRKDITNLFLGTGLGSRSYSVIEQGMITRVIEAKPDELRVFLEEAAGISKYKERRRETENRIQHANDNLSRVNDIRDELEKQLTNLERQSRAAERYQELKQEERALKAEILGIRWRDANREAQAGTRVLAERENAAERTAAELRSVEAGIAKLREDQHSATEHFNAVQASYYGVGSDISRLEQAIQHAQDRRQQLEQDLSRARVTVVDTDAHIGKEEQGSHAIATEIAAIEPDFAAAGIAERESYATLDRRELAMQTWQTEWDEFNKRAAASAQTEQIEQTKLEHLQQDLEGSQQRIALLRDQLEVLKPEVLRSQMHDLEIRVRQSTEHHERIVDEREHRRRRERDLRSHIDEVGERLHEERGDYQEIRARIASLEALSQSALGVDRQAVMIWLQQLGLGDAQRVAGEIEVDAGWEQAVETAIRIPLDAIRVQSLRDILVDRERLPGGALTLFESGASPDDPAVSRRLPAQLLLEKVRAPWPLGRLLAGIYAVATLDEAMALAEDLRDFETVVTRDGYLLGRGWLRLQAPRVESGGAIARELELKGLRARSAADLIRIESRQEQLDSLRRDLAAVAEEPDRASDLNASQEQIAALRSELATTVARLGHELERRSALEQELSELEDQVALDSDGAETARDRIHEVQSSTANIEGERTALLARRDQIREALQLAREAWRNARDAVHGITLHIETMRSRKSALDQSLERHRELLEQARSRCLDLEGVIRTAEDPLADRRRDLESALGRRLEIEGRLTAARRRLQDIDEALRGAEQKRNESEQVLQQRRDELETARIEARALEVRQQDLEEQFQAIGTDLAAVIEDLPPDRTQEACAAELERVDRRIQRLGPINLAAIDEFTRLSERKDYLDKQYGDLIEALETLEGAIRKIDRETRTRFKETYDKVNTHLQRLFPILFGGGHAYLEMTGADLLETGVTVMARPPGKRNSTIHLLSGGEKALTALALVFAIFELNPAPFCLLDEVDAPLDDANVYRFCDLVKSMAHAVQFVFVTHNKITMEIAEQLIGVTMQEAGVSRLVAVDMEEAVEMAASA